MKGAAARDDNHINEGINVSAFSRLQTRERVHVKLTQLCWQLKGKLRSITVSAAASVAQQTTQTCLKSVESAIHVKWSLATNLLARSPPLLCHKWLHHS